MEAHRRARYLFFSLRSESTMENIFFEGWESTYRTVILTVLGYLSMIFLLRISGKRTLSKMNAFDFVVTIALGSCLASVSLNKDIMLVDGITAFGLFIFLQFCFTFLAVRVKGFRQLITAKPSLVFYKGQFLMSEMKKQRLTTDEVFNACRLRGYTSLDNIYLIVLEPTGNLSIISDPKSGAIDTRSNLPKLPPSESKA